MTIAGYDIEEFQFDEGEGTYFTVMVEESEQWRFLMRCETMREAIDRAEDHKRGIRYVNVYEIHRCYGGPEEGGWWFDAGELITTETHGSLKSAEQAKQRLELEYNNDNRPPLHSVLNNGFYQINIDPLPGKNWPDRKPYYS